MAPVELHALSEAVADIRRRRGVADSDTLLDESLALLEGLASRADARRAADRVAKPRRGRPASVPDDPFPEVDGHSREINTLKQHMLRVARDGDVTVLIVGESGTGKERVARGVHRASPRHRAAFEVVNCAGLSPTLVENELFGHVRGAFTGATFDQPGPFERANGGTVFLDEVGDLTPDLQMKLLRALQQRAVQRLGGTRETPFDARVIAATNVDLRLAKARGRFREDLYYRLKVYELRVPPLRRRGPEDLHELANAILAHLGERRQRPPPSLDPAVLERLVGYTWPGNVRELENTLERMMVAAADASLLIPDHLPEDFGRDVVHDVAMSPGAISGVRLPSAAEVRSALERNGFKSGRTAVELGISRHQLYRLRRTL